MPKIKSIKSIKLIEAFGGIGTFRKALENLGFTVETRDYIEWWEYAVTAYNYLHDNSKKAKDIRNYEWEVDIFAHGSPCTDFSKAGLLDISKGRSILYMEVLRLISDLPFKSRPKFIIWENVKNLSSKRLKPYFDYYIKKLDDLGYDSQWKILNSKDFGIPQNRERVFVVSIKKGLNINFDFQNIQYEKHKPLETFLEDNETIDKNLWYTNDKLSKAIKRGYYNQQEWNFNKNGNVYLPLTSFTADNQVNKNLAPTLRANANSKILIPIKIGQNHFNSRGKILINIENSYNQESRVYNALDINTYVDTLTTNFKSSKLAFKINSNNETPSGLTLNYCIKNNISVFKIDKELYAVRHLTPKEYWRLMGWKDTEIDKVKLPKTKMYFLAGNAIVINVIESIFKELFKIKMHSSSKFNFRNED